MQYIWVPWRDAAQAVADEMLEDELKEIMEDEKEGKGGGEVVFGPENASDGKEGEGKAARTSGGKKYM